jgi:hypothetical protein
MRLNFSRVRFVYTPVRIFAILCLCLASASAAETKKPERDTPPKIERDELKIEGWRVELDRRLAEGGERADVGRLAVRLLGDKLYEIAQFLPEDRLQKLRAVSIVVDLDHGKLTSMQYHPGAGWLKEHGYDPALVKKVHIPAATRMIDVRHQRTQPWCVLHELAHAYHDQVLDFENEKVKAAFAAARDGGTYAEVRHIHGHKTKHYALSNQMEYFAELSEAYVGTNDFYPFVRAELKEHDPTAYALLEEIWGKLP